MKNLRRRSSLFLIYILTNLSFLVPTLGAGLPRSLPFPWGAGFFHFEVRNEVLFHQDYRDTRIKSSSLFPIASLSKQMTAYVIYSLISEGRLTEETKVTDFFPELPVRPTRIIDLIEHTSGIDDYETTSATEMSLGHFNCEKLSEFEEMESRQEFYYSNKGYCLLAKISERILNKPFSQIMRERVFLPLGMTSSLSAELEQSFPELLGFAPIESDLNRFIPALPQNYYGSAGVVTTGDDLAKWKKILQSPEFLPQTFLTEIEEELKTQPQGSTIYKRGLHFQWIRNELMVMHTGKIEGHTSILIYFPKSQIFSFILLDMSPESEISGTGVYFIQKLRESLALLDSVN